MASVGKDELHHALGFDENTDLCEGGISLGQVRLTYSFPQQRLKCSSNVAGVDFDLS